MFVPDSCDALFGTSDTHWRVYIHLKPKQKMLEYCQIPCLAQEITKKKSVMNEVVNCPSKKESKTRYGEFL